MPEEMRKVAWLQQARAAGLYEKFAFSWFAMVSFTQATGSDIHAIGHPALSFFGSTGFRIKPVAGRCEHRARLGKLGRVMDSRLSAGLTGFACVRFVIRQRLGVDELNGN
jgi:hypothetical protein